MKYKLVWRQGVSEVVEVVRRDVVKKGMCRGGLLERLVVPVKLRGFPVGDMLSEGVGPLLVNVVLVILPGKARPKFVVVGLVFVDLLVVV